MPSYFHRTGKVNNGDLSRELEKQHPRSSGISFLPLQTMYLKRTSGCGEAKITRPTGNWSVKRPWKARVWVCGVWGGPLTLPSGDRLTPAKASSAPHDRPSLRYTSQSYMHCIHDPVMRDRIQKSCSCHRFSLFRPHPSVYTPREQSEERL